MEVSKSEPLKTKKVSSLVLSFAFTSFVALVVCSIYNLTDALFISWGVGETAMGGVSIVYPFMILQSAISTSLGGGAASLISRKLGESKKAESGNITLNTMLAFYITSIIVSLLGFIFLDQILTLSGASGEIYAYAKEYFVIILIGNIFSTGFSSIIRAEGKVVYSMLIWVIPIVSNIVLDAVFIFGFKLGVKGSAIATIISQGISSLMSLIFFIRFTSQKFTQFKPSIKVIANILSIGLPSLVQVGSLSIIIAFINKIIGQISGDQALIAFSYMSKIMAFIILPLSAISQGLSPIVGYNYGQKDYSRVKSAVKYSFILSFIFSIVIFGIIEIFPQYLISIFTNSTNLIEIGSFGLRIIGLSFLCSYVPLLIGSIFQAIGKRILSLLVFGANMIFCISLLMIFSSFGLVTIWWIYSISSLLAALVSITIFVLYDKKNKKNKEVNSFC